MEERSLCEYPCDCCGSKAEARRRRSAQAMSDASWIEIQPVPSSMPVPTLREVFVIQAAENSRLRALLREIRAGGYGCSTRQLVDAITETLGDGA